MSVKKFMMPTSLIFLLLFSVAIQSSFAFAEEDKKVAEELINVVQRAVLAVNQTIQSLKAQGIEISEDTKEHYINGLQLADKAKELFDEGNYKKSSRISLASLNKLRATLSKISKQVIGEEEEKIHRLRIAINRTKAFINKLKVLVEKAEALGYDVNEVEKKLDDANNRLRNAESHVGKNDVSKAAKMLAEARKLIAQGIKELQKIVKPEIVKQAKKFVSIAIKHLDDEKEKILKLPIPDEEKEKIISNIEEAKKHLISANQNLKMNDVQKALIRFKFMVKAYKKYAEWKKAKNNILKLLKKEIERIEKELEMLKKKLDAIDEEKKGVVGEKISEIEKLVKDTKEKIGKGELKDVINTLTKIRKMIREVKQMLKE